MDERSNWTASLSLENLTLEQVDELIVKIVEIVEDMGGFVGGGFMPEGKEAPPTKLVCVLAPGLLEACERLLGAAEMHRAWEVHSAEDFGKMYPDVEGWAHGDVDDNLLRAMDEARAIIAKAKGAS